MFQIASVVQNKLLPSLSRAPAGVEGLRVYLILPELLRALETHLKRDLCVSFASTVLKLDTISLKILGCPNEKWKMLLPEELMAVLSGNVNYVWEDLRKELLHKFRPE
ncbi:hypothetical protein JZ751_006013 [Albula glossodonta]|uniref:Uncharacterized protein n=1 Tax=Albula glossodonta TaxID=121402 RepID=A0A8T2P5Z9_9TELE|nr:hypothetical protein JZ751_006013 [Albula glossodonta]